jgi:hypothetical protein
MTKAAVVGIVGLSLIGAEGSARADFITNGNFSSTSISGNANGLIYSTSSPSGYNGASLLTGWNVVAGSPAAPDLGFVYSGNYGQTISYSIGGGSSAFTLSDPSQVVASPNGGNFIAVDADVNHSLAIYQTLTSLSANTTYTLTFYQATDSQAGFSPSGTADWSVSFGNATDGYEGYTSAAMAVSTSFNGWQQVTTTLTTGAHASSETLQFFAAGPGGGPPMLFLDGVSLVNPTPEPSTLVISGLGLLAMIPYGLRRRRKATAQPSGC